MTSRPRSCGRSAPLTGLMRSGSPRPSEPESTLRLIDVDHGEHRQPAPRPSLGKAERDVALARPGIGAEQMVPDRHVAEIAGVDVALVVEDVRLGPLDEPAGPGRRPHV